MMHCVITIMSQKVNNFVETPNTPTPHSYPLTQNFNQYDSLSLSHNASFFILYFLTKIKPKNHFLR